MKTDKMNINSKTLKMMNGKNLVLFLVLMGMTVIFTAVNPNFIKTYNLLSMAQSLVPYAVIALGETFVIACGQTDLSLGGACIASAAIAGKIYALGAPLWLTIPIMMAVGIAVGIINGVLVAKLKVPAFIATLGTMMFIRGFSALLVADPNIYFPSATWFNRLFSNCNGIPTGMAWLALFVIVAAYLAYKNKIGRYILAIGSNPEASRLSGIRSDRYIFTAYIISGLTAGIAAIFWAASFATITVATGNGMEFDAIAAVYIGGTNAAGGTACVGGSIIGMMMLTIIRSGLNFALSRFNINVNSTYLTYVMTGVIIVAAILLDIRKKHIRPRLENRIEKSSHKKPITVIAVIAAVALIVGMFFVCFDLAKSEKTTEPIVSVVSKGESDSFWSRVKSGCAMGAEKYGYRLNYRAPQGTDASYLPEALNHMQNALSNGSAAIVVASICEGYTDMLAQAYDAGIPVVQYDSGVYTADIAALDSIGKNPIVSTVSTNSYDASKLCAENCFEKVKAEIAATDGEYLVGIIQYEQSTTAEDRVNGFIDGFTALADADPATKGKCKFSVEVKPDATNNNYKIALEALTEKGARLIFTASAVSMLQVSDAIAASGERYNDIRFATFDCGTAAIEWVKKTDGPILLGGVIQNTIEMGNRAVECAVLASQNKEFEKEIFIDGIWFDSENIDDLLEEDIAYYG